MTNEEAVARLESLKDYEGDAEVMHIYADRVLLEFVPEEVRKAFEELEDLVGGFWYA